jgi:hypothetical protein
MRGCLTFLLLVVVTILVASWLFLPAVAGGAVVAALGAGGFMGSPASATVSSDPPIELLGGHADRIVIQARDATFHELSAATVDLTLTDVSLFDRTAGTVSGTLTGIRMVPRSGHVLPVSSAKLSGSSSAIQARLSLSLADVSAIAASALTSAAGGTPSKVTLAAPDKVSIVLSGVTVSGRVAVDDQGGLVFRSTAATLAVAGPIDLIRPGPGLPIRIRTVALTASGAILTATVDPAALSG